MRNWFCTDLEEPLAFAADASFDGAVCALVFHHIRNREQLLSELRRVLRPGGWLLMSTSHPTAD
ncbi:class I SAM-dependent methyltransferase [Nonomuraea fuscirosea]|uniref:class I SAM-dependent methyltransferase n=1 Tax=Nonomuraea fuscirosea TaxID=1291556 RepID=UPI00344A93F2